MFDSPSKETQHDRDLEYLTDALYEVGKIYKARFDFDLWENNGPVAFDLSTLTIFLGVEEAVKGPKIYSALVQKPDGELTGLLITRDRLGTMATHRVEVFRTAEEYWTAKEKAMGNDGHDGPEHSCSICHPKQSKQKSRRSHPPTRGEDERRRIAKKRVQAERNRRKARRNR